jgi:hypothetical protein
VAAGSALLLEKPLNAAAMTATEPQLLVIDYDIAEARRLAAHAAGSASRTLAITGDRVRFARDLFGSSAPEVIGGLTSYADFIVLTGCAAEAGYRLISERTESALVRWKIARLTS